MLKNSCNYVRKKINERDAFSGCFQSAHILICLYHMLKSLRREITCEKMRFTAAELAHCLKTLQSIVFSKPEEECNKNLIQLKNAKLILRF